MSDELFQLNLKVSPLLRAISLLLSVSVLASVAAQFYYLDEASALSTTTIFDVILLIVFGVHFAVRLFITHDRITFLKSRWLEGLAALLAFVFGLELLTTDDQILITYLDQLGLPGTETTLLYLIQGYLMLLVGIKVIQNVPTFVAQNTNPARMVLVSFSSAIVVGMLLLMLPAATVDGIGLGFTNALFMSTSAICVTGLIVVDTATHLTMFGQAVILVLIQLGGIGVVTFATFLAMYISDGIGVTEKNILKETISGEKVATIATTLKRIVILTLSIEFIGVISFYLSWTDIISDAGQRFWFSLFHSISAFCNAGFSLYTNSLSDPVNATFWPVNITTMVLIILGGLGFTTIREIIVKFTKQKKNYKFSVHSIIVFRMTLFLIITGMALVLLIEWNGVLSDYSTSDKLLLSLFQSVTSRTAGFNTLDTGALSSAATLVVIILMAIGASPSSTAGGLKTTTVYVLFRAMKANISGFDRIELAHRTIPQRVVFRAVTAVISASFFILAGLIIITSVEEFSFLDILFEQISAFMTVGLSRGITAELSDISKHVLIASMFAGRVGMLTVAVAFAKKVATRNYAYPEEDVMVS